MLSVFQLFLIKLIFLCESEGFFKYLFCSLGIMNEIVHEISWKKVKYFTAQASNRKTIPKLFP